MPQNSKTTYILYSQGFTQALPCMAFAQKFNKIEFTTTTHSNYEHFGMAMEGRTFESMDYKFGFNGQVKDDEIYGPGNTYDLGFREYDARLARMFSIDPRSPEYSWQSPYAYHRNSPIKWIDFMGGGDEKPWYVEQKTGNVKWFLNDKLAEGKGLKKLGEDKFFGAKGNADIANWKEAGKKESSTLSQIDIITKYQYKYVPTQDVLQIYRRSASAQTTSDGRNYGNQTATQGSTIRIWEETTYVPSTYKPFLLFEGKDINDNGFWSSVLGWENSITYTRRYITWQLTPDVFTPLYTPMKPITTFNSWDELLEKQPKIYNEINANLKDEKN